MMMMAIMMMMITKIIRPRDDELGVIIRVDHLMAALLWCLSSKGAFP